MIRILHVLGGLNRGGAESMIMNLYRKIDRNSFQFDFIIHTNGDQDFSSEVIELGGKIFVFPKFNGKNYRELKTKWSEFFKAHPEYKILHSHVRSYASLYIPIAKKNNVKTIIHSHSTSNGKGFKSLVKKALQYPLRFQADRFIGCSEASGKWLFGSRIIKSEKYSTLQNAITLENFVNDPVRRSILRDKLKISGKCYIHVGRLHPAKNHGFLLDCFARIVSDDPQAVLLIVGDGECKDEIKKKIDELGIGESVRMLGSRADVPELLLAADVFLFPSIWEGVPLTVVEAQAAGLPCIVSDRVTEDVCVSELVTRLPISDPTVWAKNANSITPYRIDVRNMISDAGYDVKQNAVLLEKYYLELVD